MIKLSEYYKQSIELGKNFQQNNPKNWAGNDSKSYHNYIRFLMDRYSAQTVLDYGCGESMEEGSLGTVLPWPEVVNKINSAMKAMGWKGQRRDDGSFMFSTKGQLDDEFYIVIIDNEGNSMFTYALGTVEEGDPHIGEQDTLPTTEASVSELMTAIQDGFGFKCWVAYLMLIYPGLNTN